MPRYDERDPRSERIIDFAFCTIVVVGIVALLLAL